MQWILSSMLLAHYTSRLNSLKARIQSDTIVSINELSKPYNGFFDDESVLSYLFLRTIKDPLIAFDCTDDHYYERSKQERAEITHAERKKIKQK